MLVEDRLRPAAVKAGILSSHRDVGGQLVDDDPRRFGFHNLRHSLASFLIRIRTDPKTVQTLLRHSHVKLTLQFYTHAVSWDRKAAAGKMLAAILSHATNQSGLAASKATRLSPLKTMVARDGVARHYTFPVTLPLTGIQLDPKSDRVHSAASQ